METPIFDSLEGPVTVLDASVRTASSRLPRTRHYVMCQPEHFAVEYAINPWMDLANPVDPERARLQWEVLRNTYLTLGHRVDLIDPLSSQPDMVFAANGGLVVGDRAYGARFRYPERAAEGAAYSAWLSAQGLTVTIPTATNEGEGDFLVLADRILAGTGFRTITDAHVEAATTLGRPVVSLELVDPRFYHLDVALTVLDDGRGDTPADIAWLPEAFSSHSQTVVRELYPDALVVGEADAVVLGLNAVSDGRHVVLPTQAGELANRLHERGYLPVPVDLSEFLKSGGSVKCCTMERHA